MRNVVDEYRACGASLERLLAARRVCALEEMPMVDDAITRVTRTRTSLGTGLLRLADALTSGPPELLEEFDADLLAGLDEIREELEPALCAHGSSSDDPWAGY